MEIQVWDMIVKTERELMERRLERKARYGRPSIASLVKATRQPVRGWRLNPFATAHVRTREAS
jgi:hypothetical protein